jgi:hypothetical protein
MLLVIRHFNPALAVVAGGIIGVCSVALGVATGSSFFVVSGAISVVLAAVRTNHKVQDARREAGS